MTQQAPTALSPKDQALWRAGRNLAAFQELEARLKQVVPLLSGAGTIETLTASITAHRRQIKKSTLGDLINQFEERLFSEADLEQPPASSSSIHFSFTTTIEVSKEESRAMRKSWKQLVYERNRLAHSDFMSRDLENESECTSFCTMLDAQFRRVLSLLSEVEGIQSGLAAAAKAQMEYLQSDEFQRARNRESDTNDA